MTIHYHGTPITPASVLYKLSGHFFCVSHANPGDIVKCHQIGQGVMLDNGAFSKWKTGKTTNWYEYYDWCLKWCEYTNTWAIPPDVIDGSEEFQDDLLLQWPHGKVQAAPVWHMNESISRLCRLIDNGWSRVCIGSTSKYMIVLSPIWSSRMNDIWDELSVVFGKTPVIHMLRGMQLSDKDWPFSSVDSTDIARNHCKRTRSGKISVKDIANRWDSKQCPPKWVKSENLFEGLL